MRFLVPKQLVTDLSRDARPVLGLVTYTAMPAVERSPRRSVSSWSNPNHLESHMKRILLISALTFGCSAAFAQMHSQPMQPASPPASQPTVQVVQLASGPIGEPQPGEHRMHHIPPEIAAACEGKPVGTKVDVTFRDGNTRNIECGVHPHFHHPHFGPVEAAASGPAGQGAPGNPAPAQ
jgi:hypothetical protein